VKICGITSPADALLAEAAGADAIGVVLFSASPRCITPESARDIFDAVPALTRVCVTHSTEPGELQSICAIRPDALQISCQVCVPPECRAGIIRMVGPADPLPPEADALIVDGSHGRGQPFDQAFACTIVRTARVPVYLAGGLSPENVGAAIRAVRPHGVDVASGVEHEPGRKDPVKVSAFVAAAREAFL
jgi:phosphoribosylanthranilate isomerase